MYCKNCGRELKEGTRFCDRCGQSVRQNKTPNRKLEAQKLQEERLNRKQRMAEAEERRSKKKQVAQKKKKNYTWLFLIVILLILIISVIISYLLTTSASNEAEWRKKDETVELNATPSPSPVSTPASTGITIGSATPSASAPQIEDNINSDGYKIFELGAVKCPYPSGFAKKTIETNQKLSLADSKGGATMSVSSESSQGLDAANLMRDFAKTNGGTIEYSRAGTGWYSITISTDGIITHRKCLIVGNEIIYYDFQYSSTSSSADEYQKNIQYIDENFKL